MRRPAIADLPRPPPGKTGWPWTDDGGRSPTNGGSRHSWPRVSVVTPSFNQGRYLEETIRSVLLQDYDDLEYIVMDGGSTDGSVEIIRKYEAWLADWVSEPDQGQTDAINRGWRRATGDVLAYINSDDLYLPRAVSVAAGAFLGEDGPAMVYGNAAIVDEGGRALRVWRARPFSLRAMLTAGSVVPQPTAFYSSSALTEAGFLSDRWHMIMDYELAVRIGLRHRTVCLPHTLARFRDHGDSKSRTRFPLMARELLQFIAELEAEETTDHELQAMKRTAASRVHYEWAVACLTNNASLATIARHLRRSMRLDARYALARPLDTTYIVKEVIMRRLSSSRQPHGEG